MSTTVIELENKDIVVKMSGQGPIGPRGQQGEPGPAGPSEWGVIQGNISDQTDLQNALDAKADVGASYTKSEEDALLAQKADADNVYTKTETDSLLADKADADSVYTKTEVNTLLSGKADSDTVYTKAETDALLGAKADVGDSYTKAEEDALLAVKANSADVYTKTETDTLLADKADADDVYTKTEVDDALADKADSADVYTKTETDDMLLAKAPVITETASGSIASFTDGTPAPVTALSVSIEPVQEGTGDPSPGTPITLPAFEQGTINGSGNLENSSTRVRTSDFFIANGSNYRIEFDADKVATVRVYSPSGPYLLSESITSWTASPISRTITNGRKVKIVLAYSNNSNIVPSDVTKCVVYENVNVRPISGRTSATVTRTGKNLCPSTDWEIGQYGNNGWNVQNNRKTSPYIRILPNTAYTMSIDQNGTADLAWINFNYFDRNKTWLGARTENGDASFNRERTKTFTIHNSNAWYVRLTARSYSNSEKDISAQDIATGTPQLELGSSASAYEAPSIQTVTIDLDGTRYGGTLNVLTGTMTVDRAYVEFDGSEDEAWYKISGGKPAYTNVIKNLINPPASASVKADLISNEFVVETSGQTWNANVIGIGSSSAGVISISLHNDQTETSVAEIQQFLAQSPAQVVYKLKTPLTVQLTPSQMQTLLGENHLFADTGDVAVTYRADTKLFIQESLQSQSNALKLMLTPNVETEMVASQNYALGSIVIVNNDFLKLTSAVASGANLVIGSNCVKTTMAEWVASLMA